MYIYAGIDEAGYGPLLGPLVVGQAVLAIHDAAMTPQTPPPNLWKLLKAAVCTGTKDKRRRIAVNDSKKLHTQSAGIRHLELGVLAFAGMAGWEATTLDAWLDYLGEASHREPGPLAWYAPTADRPWDPQPMVCEAAEIGIARNMLAKAAQAAGVEVLRLDAAIVFEDRFNQMVAATRSKASASFTFVARHLQAVWQAYGEQGPRVVVDRQSGRMRYRELLSQAFPEAQFTVLDESADCSIYAMTAPASGERPARSMQVSFEVEAEQRHLPVALASMLAKYNREILMARFQAYFQQRAPHIKPTAGYGADGKRFWEEIQPLLADWHIDGRILRRLA